MILILTIYGRLNFLSMARHGDSCESRFRQNFKKEFDWCAFNGSMLLEEGAHTIAIALDHSFICKSGKKTPGLGRYWSRSDGMSKRGLGILGFAQVGTGVSEEVDVDGEKVILYSATVKGKFLKRKIKTVIVEIQRGGKVMRKILFSTNLEMAASDIFLIYHSRFQIEFLYRDAKQNTGLEHWQSTDADRLSFGYNASLSAVKVAKETAQRIYEATGRRLSVASVKRVLHNTSLYQHIMKFIEGQKSDSQNKNYDLTEDIPHNLLFFGVRDSA